MTGKGALERMIMDVLWAAETPLLVRELRERVNARADRPLAYTTVQTVADRLVGKELLVRTPDGIAYRYGPARRREDHVAALMLEALSALPDHGPALARFAEGIDPADAHRLLEELSRRALGASRSPSEPGGE
ncbi:MAG: transcriptional repressor, CopY family [Actinomycetia bacterium]|nr:transcriptional repressor, CopY family [Actinomycetes bacterium]